MDNKFTLNRKLFKNNNEKLTQKEYIELLRNYNYYTSKKKNNEDLKNQNNKTEISPNITQRNQFLKQSNSTININEKTEKNEKSERETISSKTPERIIILSKRNQQNTLKNVFKHYRSPPIIYQPENGDNLIKRKIEKNNVIKKEKDEMSTLSTSNISTPVKNEDKKYNKFTNTKTNNFVKYQRNIIGKASITPDRTLNYKSNFTQRETLSTSVDTKRNGKGNNIINHEKEYQTLNLEDLIMIEDKFNNIVKNVYNKNFQVVSKICYEWWNFYFNCSLKGSCEYFFNNNQIKNIIFSQNSLLLISIMIVYDLSYKDIYFYKCYEIMKNILFLNHQNFLIICQYLLSRIRKEYLKLSWVDLLKTIIQKRLNNNNNVSIVEIEKNLIQLNKLIKILHQTLNSQNQIINPKIIEIFNNYNSISSNIINKIFMINILHIDNESGSLLFSNLRDSIPKTYNNYIIKNPPLKPLTLVLDLDETLMSFVYTREKTGQGLLRMRPYLYNFLNSVKEYYELIIFTASTQNYADSILDAIEEFKGQFFSYRLYRNHCSILNNDFVKDISLIGRDLSKTIIVDNMQQNFKLQKENGILISSFWGEDVNDKALLQLRRILVGFGNEMRSVKYNCDIRQLISKYKDDIVKNVSMG